MRKLYEYRTDTMSQHLPDTAILTHGKMVSQLSSYNYGTTTYLNYLHFKLGFIDLYRGWFTEATTGDYR